MEARDGTRVKRIAVLVSVGRHPVSGVARYSRNDAAALEIGRTLAGRWGAQLDVLHAGDARNPALEGYLALGAERVEVLACGNADEDNEGAAVAALAARVQGYDLVLTGTCAEGAFDSGLLPYQLADRLGYPLVNAAVDVAPEPGMSGAAGTAAVRVRQFLPKGLRRAVAVTLPAVVAVHPLAAVAPRYAYARLRAGAIMAGRPEAAAQPGSQRGSQQALSGREQRTMTDEQPWTIGPIERKPVRLAAAEKRSGHARMLSATTTESRGGSVVIEGSSVEKAQVILRYLREHQLIDY
ncbi:electron transfer flavoprotein subunit beta/FixA family protein [Paraburkholderia kururiensis]|uniref:Electron transfer flavoprotein subunit beta/FixA family protein n=1 Tax=Paraburkholderia kururiensis TaxID=984307 RepID=A0ABZ0WVC0_9BURK|nr:electron transfer flavoprotein subunit beta/FixA family protein [Paraburkholderia kururiensis]WQD81181.1 electron transfer flavoprotein subunit beta/FixA family protein [Paraburkholderia kururiensis]